MNLSISTNTQAILLLTAPLITGKNGATNGELLSPGEYRQFARQLRELGHAPADLLGTNSPELVRELDGIVRADRIRRLLDRGFLISQAIERWQSRAIWVLSRADTEYPKKLKNRIRGDSPAVLYGCGQPKLLETGGLAIVGSRHVDQTLIEYTEAVGCQCASAKISVISGGAPGIDRAAMRGSLGARGRAVGVLADSLERAALNRENRDWLLDEQLVLVSPYDPSAGFNVGHAMQRNKVIYALADAALVVSADYEKGGTWAGASEQLQNLRLVPIYVRSTGEIGRGLQALTRMGAQPWPNPQDSDQLLSVFELTSVTPTGQQPQLTFRSDVADVENVRTVSDQSEKGCVPEDSNSDENLGQPLNSHCQESSDILLRITNQQSVSEPAETLIACVREILVGLLATPKDESQIASLLQVSNPQARTWLRRLVQEGVLEKRTKPVRFVLKQKTLL